MQYQDISNRLHKVLEQLEEITDLFEALHLQKENVANEDFLRR
jgi:hypothetical protein